MRSLLRWEKSRKVPDIKRKDFKLVYGWASPQIAALSPCPYIYVFSISPSSRYAKNGLRSGRRTRQIVFSEVILPNSYRRQSDANKMAADIWNEIIPSDSRAATHRFEIGILRKGSETPRSPFFSEYFCFSAINSRKASDRIAIQIAGFVADQLEECKVFDGAAIEGNKTYWLMVVYAGWKFFGR